MNFDDKLKLIWDKIEGYNGNVDEYDSFKKQIKQAIAEELPKENELFDLILEYFVEANSSPDRITKVVLCEIKKRLGIEK